MNNLILLNNPIAAIQKLPIYVYRDGSYHVPITGDALNITATYSKDFATPASLGSNPTELDSTNMPGIYYFTLSTSWIDGFMTIFYPTSSTSSTQIDPITVVNKINLRNDYQNHFTIMSSIKNFNDSVVSEDPNSFYATLTDQMDTINGDVEAIGLKKNTAYNYFYFVLYKLSDPLSPCTGQTVTVQLSKDGAAFADADNTPATELSDGVYYINLSASDLNADSIMFKATSSDSITRFISITTNDN